MVDQLQYATGYWLCCSSFTVYGCSGDYKSFNDNKIQYDGSDRCRVSDAVVFAAQEPISQPLVKFDGEQWNSI